VQRAKSGPWCELAPQLRNGAWEPTAQAEGQVAAAPGGPVTTGAWIMVFQRLLPVLGVAGLAAWGVLTPFRADVPSLSQGRAEAIAAADAALAARGIALGSEWQRTALPNLAIDEAGSRLWHRFVWRAGGPEVYRQLIGATLAPPLWEVRYAKFEGDVAERA